MKKSFTNLPLFFLFLTFAISISSCKNNKENDIAQDEITAENNIQEPFFKLSLAQWSLNKPIREGDMDPMDFAQKASEMGFEGIEYVNQLYRKQLDAGDDPEAALADLLDSLKAKSEKYNVENVLIMVDGEGDLATPDESLQNQAVENHKKWVDAAEFLGAHSIRVNLFGSNEPEEWKTAAVDGLTKLAEYASEKNINILVENHGGLSSNAGLLAEVMKEVGLQNTGTLPDFGNFCLKREASSCVEEYPKYQGVEEMMPYAKAVSAKSNDFDEDGQETNIDYSRMLQIVKDHGYTGYIGVEYEGERLPAEEGIMATKELLIAEGSNLN